MCLTLIDYFCISKKRLRDEHDKSCVQFRLHEEIKSRRQQSKELGRISKMFEPKSESQRPENANSSNGSDFETG